MANRTFGFSCSTAGRNRPSIRRASAALAWAESLTHIATTHAPDDVYTAARREFSEKELADLSIAIAMINAWNRLCVGARVIHPAETQKAA